jgi:putative Mg2+ transporter-C (MgtC) family protein
MVMTMLGIGIGDLVLRLGAAALFGLLVGIDRERGGRAAGIRTMALVGLGSALFTVAGAYGFNNFTATQHFSLDPTRVMAQIVSGIGFLGAGLIFLRRDVVRGLTTAAALWVVAAIGMACGAGLWAAGVAGIVLALLLLAALRPFERLVFPQHGPRQLIIRLDSVDEAGEAIPRIRAICTQHGIQVDQFTLRPAKSHGEIIELRCRIKRPEDLAQAMLPLRQIPGVNAVRANVRALEASAPGDED